MSTDKHKPTIDEMEDSINAGGDVPFEILPSGEIVTKELKNVQPVMGGKFSDNPDPPCVHCGEDAIELEHLRTRVAQMELDNFELRNSTELLASFTKDKIAELEAEKERLLKAGFDMSKEVDRLREKLSAEGIAP